MISAGVMVMGSLVGTKESLAGPELMVDVQPHPVDWKY
jgi:hypothetical protein